METARDPLWCYWGKQGPTNPPHLALNNRLNFCLHLLQQATASKLKLEHFYKKAVEEVVERNQR